MSLSCVLVTGFAVHGLAEDLVAGVEQDLAGERRVLTAVHAEGVVEEAEVAEGHRGGGAGQVSRGIGHGLGDEGEAGPVEIDVAEVGALGGEGGGGLGRLEEEVFLGGGGDLVGERVNGGDLEEVGGFDDAVPAEGIDGVGADGGAEDGDVAVVRRAGEVFGVEALVAAESVKREDAEQGEGGPAAAGEALATRTDLGR